LKTKKIKLIATDIDGTIMDRSFECSPGVKNCIKKLTKEGIKVVLATGRMHVAAAPVAKQLGLDTPVISYQGGLIKQQDGATLYERNLDTSAAAEIIRWAKGNNIHLNLYMEDKLYAERDTEAIRRYTCERSVPYSICELDKIELKNVNKILAIDFKDIQRVTSWVNYLRENFPQLYIIKSSPYFCEISNPEATKAYAVEFLRQRWGIEKDEVLTIGDQDNDIELLKAGGISVAMGNATENLKSCADYITDTVDNDGFVQACLALVEGAC
jgi:Cof subfamily protein (haloacid dehalogenase superfamily)